MENSMSDARGGKSRYHGGIREDQGSGCRGYLDICI